MNRRLLLVLLILTFIPAAQPQELPPDITGYVTRATSPADFDVNGIRVASTAQTTVKHKQGTMFSTEGDDAPYVGQSAQVFGKINHKTHTIKATGVILESPSPARVRGFGVIDRVLSPKNVNPGEKMVRADGYAILLNAKTEAIFTAPLTSLADAGTNVWIGFEGEQRPDGVVVASRCALVANQIKHSEDKLRSKMDYDAANVAADSKQNMMFEAFVGIDPRKIPPYKDEALQARIDRIGASLVPEYQRALPDSDPTKIHFRFQLIDWKNLDWKTRDALTLPSGIILVPKQVVERMQNDSQLATVLADNIACALEKQGYLALTVKHQMVEAGLLVSEVGVLVVPELTLAAIHSKWQQQRLNQSGRVSLGLLVDAKYDIHQAPLAWWLLASKKPKDLAATELPERAAYLYQMLGVNWHNAPPLGE